MQAVILVGGEGTRLRPLTSTVPKPVVPLVDRPFIAYMLEWLRAPRRGRRRHVLRLPGHRRAQRARRRSQYGLRLRFIEEPEPRGTAGALKYAEDFLDERFLMLNGDVLTDLDLTAQIAQHEATGAVGTLALVPSPTPPPTASCACTTTSRSRSSSRSRAPTRSTPAHLGRRLRARARGARPHPGRSQRLDRARGVAQLVGDGLYGFAAEPIGWTSARPSATCRAPSTSSRATSRRPWPTASGPATWRSATACRPTGASCRRRSSSAAARSPRARTSVAGRARRGRQRGGGHDDRALGGPQRRRDRRGRVLRDCIVAAGVRIGEARSSRRRGPGRGSDGGAAQRPPRGVRVFPQTDLPEGAITF